MSALGLPHLHYATTESTSDRARELAGTGAPHGTIVTADDQTAGRGRMGRSWRAPAGQALLLSVVLRDAPPLLTMRAGVAVAAACGPPARLKWPNDVVVDDRKVAGILCEQVAGQDWAVAGIGVNLAVELEQMPADLRGTAGTLALNAAEIPRWRDRLLEELEAALATTQSELLAAWSDRDYLHGCQVRWDGGSGIAAGIDGEGRLLVETERGRIALESGEVSLARVS